MGVGVRMMEHKIFIIVGSLAFFVLFFSMNAVKASVIELTFDFHRPII